MRFQIQWLKEGSSDPSSSGSAYLERRRERHVGRETGVDIQLKDRNVSRLHAEVYIEGGTVIIKDAGSTNGTTSTANGSCNRVGGWGNPCASDPTG